MIELIGKYVEVVAHETVYTGRLVEVSETEVNLETEAGWVVVPLDHVAVIREKESSR